jgi:hypothetical protein
MGNNPNRDQQQKPDRDPKSEQMPRPEPGGKRSPHDLPDTEPRDPMDPVDEDARANERRGAKR